MNRKAFTLTELLITVAVLSILVALLLPALGRARKTAERTVCVNNLKQMGFATHAYAGDFDDCVPARIPEELVSSDWAPTPNYITANHGDKNRYALHGVLFSLGYLPSRKLMYCRPSAGNNAPEYAKVFLHNSWYSCSYNFTPAFGGRNGGTRGIVKSPEEMIFLKISDRPHPGEFSGYNPARYTLYMDIFGGRPMDAGECELARDYHGGAFNVSFLDGSVRAFKTSFLVKEIGVWGWNNIYYRWPALCK